LLSKEKVRFAHIRDFKFQIAPKAPGRRLTPEPRKCSGLADTPPRLWDRKKPELQRDQGSAQFSLCCTSTKNAGSRKAFGAGIFVSLFRTSARASQFESVGAKTLGECTARRQGHYPLAGS